MTEVSEPGAALCAFLRARLGERLAQVTLPDSSVSVPAVFRPNLPAWFDARQPTACLVVRPAGGYKRFGASMLYLADPAMDVIAYGTDQQQATELCRLVVFHAKRLVNEVWENTLLACANVAAGPVPLPDTQTLWPGCWCSLQLVHGELPQPADAG